MVDVAIITYISHVWPKSVFSHFKGSPLHFCLPRWQLGAGGSLGIPVQVGEGQGLCMLPSSPGLC